MTQGELYKDETYVHLKKVLSGDESGNIGVMAIRAGYNAYGFELESIDVDNIWSGKVKFNDKKYHITSMRLIQYGETGLKE
ncbi:hypothetical protein JGC56_14195 [Salmonella enterica subsp. enterica serovar Saintpaul]|nr:hypothetical protein [Salmonella enterica subsp. enterica serovar Saintpaul]